MTRQETFKRWFYHRWRVRFTLLATFVIAFALGVLVARCTYPPAVILPDAPITAAPTLTPTNTWTLSPTHTATATLSPSFTPTSTVTLSPTGTDTPSASASPTATNLPTIPAGRNTLPVTGMEAEGQGPAIYQIPPGALLDIEPLGRCKPHLLQNGDGFLVHCATFTPTPSPTDTPTNTPTDTNTPTSTATFTPSATPTITPSPTATTLQPTGQTGWQNLVVAEDFNGTALNSALWTKRANTQFGLATFTDSQVTLSNGALHLTAIRTATGYQSGAISTIGKRQFQYGFYEARMKVPKGSGLWVAWWLKSINDNLAGVYSRAEIDIAEDRGYQTDRTNMFIHYGTRDNASYVGSVSIRPLDYSQEFHTYGVNWQPSQTDFYIDGEKVWSQTGAIVPTDPMNLVVDLAVGSFAGTTDNNAFPATLDIDYVRVWQ